MTENSSEQSFPDHVDKAVRSVTQLHSEHHGRTTVPQRAVNNVAAVMGRPWFIALVGFIVVAWVAVNLITAKLGLEAIDPPPFAWLEVAATLFSLLLVVLLLVAQKHEDELNAHRDTLTLELAILSDHKIAKVIQLLEELRRDSPHVQDRDDPQAQQMAEPADTGSVLAAVRSNDEL
jgi:uncharacterized membrane protein